MMVALLAAVVFLAGFAYLLAPRLVRRLFRAPRLPERATPAALHLPFDEIALRTVGGKRLFGWLIPAIAPARGSVILLHGWGGNAASLLPLAPPLHAAGYCVLLFAARNHGRSDTDAFSSMVKFAEDLEQARVWLKQRPGVDGQRIAVVGHSVGGAAALLAASRTSGFAATVSLASFAHPAELMRRIMTQHGVPYWPLGKWVLRHVEKTIGARYHAIAPVNTIRHIRCPTLLIHGARDRRVPVADAHAIYANRSGDHVRLCTIPDAAHDSLHPLKAITDHILAFLEGSLRGRERQIHCLQEGSG